MSIPVNDNQYHVLTHLGLHEQAIACYQLLFEGGSTSAKDLAIHLHVQPSGLYRVLEELTAKGFVRVLKTHRQSITFQAVRLDVALYSLDRYHHRLVRGLVMQQIEQRPSP